MKDQNTNENPGQLSHSYNSCPYYRTLDSHNLLDIVHEWLNGKPPPADWDKSPYEWAFKLMFVGKNHVEISTKDFIN